MTADYDLSLDDYQALAEFRYQLRRFLRFSEQEARAAGIEPQQQQMLLAIKGLPPQTTASVGDLAERLQLQHHSTVELINRMVDRGLLERRRDTTDQRRVLVELTERGDDLLRKLSLLHRMELRSMAPVLVESLTALAPQLGSGKARTSPVSRSANPKRSGL
jgi:DNA-binding MarR family transcriptional regulator